MNPEERKKVLEMLSEGKISVEEAEKLLSALESGESGGKEPKPRKKKRFLKIVVNSADGDDVRITVPLALSKAVSGMLPGDLKNKLSSEVDVDIEETLKNVSEMVENLSDMEEDILNVTSSDGDVVRIYVE